MSPSLQAMQADDNQNPAMLWVAGGRERWALECTGCHGAEAATRMRGVAARYPAWDATLGRVLTLNQRIRHCRTRAPGASGAAAPAASGEGAAPAVAPSASVAAVDRGPADAVSQPRPALRDNTPDSENVLSLQALVALQSRGMAIQPAQDDATAALARQGERLFQRRLGALELSCADCHEQRAGLRLGGSVIPQGHPTGYPLYRLEWQGLGSLARRLRACVVGVRATPFAPDSTEMLALEAWLMRRAAGLTMDAPGLRP